MRPPSGWRQRASPCCAHPPRFQTRESREVRGRHPRWGLASAVATTLSTRVNQSIRFGRRLIVREIERNAVRGLILPVLLDRLRSRSRFYQFSLHSQWLQERPVCFRRRGFGSRCRRTAFHWFHPKWLRLPRPKAHPSAHIHPVPFL